MFYRHITNYLNKPETRKLLNVDASVGNFTSCSQSVGTLFSQNMDEYHLTQFYISELLERGVKVLIYVGTYDWICNWVRRLAVCCVCLFNMLCVKVGNERFTLALEWSGKHKFAGQALREWKVDGKTAGLTRSANGLTFATVEGAGHMVPHDKPVEALELVNRWLVGKPL